MRPTFVVHHLIACLDAPLAGPPNTPPPARHLMDVSYEYRVPAAFDFFAEFFPVWLYARFFLTNQCRGTRYFQVDQYWMDAPAGQNPWVATYLDRKKHEGTVLFDPNDPVVNVAWRLDRCRFLGPGRYEFRLMCDSEPHEAGFDEPVKVEHISIV